MIYLGAGWDNTVFLVDDKFIFRFPRRKVALELLETEARVLPAVAEVLSVPAPVYRGAPSAAFP